MSKNPSLLIHQEGPIKTIVFNSPATKNAISEETVALLQEAVAATHNDDSRVVILTGESGNFSAGASLNTEGLADFDVTTYLRDKINPIILGMRSCPKPFIAKVRGTCVGVGLNYALACDMIYATPDAAFSPIFTRIGLSSDGGGSFFLQQKLGYHKAFELMATGAMFGAAEAEKMGLINHCIKDEDLDNEVLNMAKKLANGPYVAIQQTKKNMVVGQAGSLADTLESEAVNQAHNFKSKDFAEGITAFLEKRKPAFTGE